MERIYFMVGYNIFQWIIYFFICSFIGYVLEIIIILIQEHVILNRGFLRGPILPIYGCGAFVLMYIGIIFESNPVLVFIVGMVACTVLEYITGTIMEATLKVRYWDYTNFKLQYKGRICVLASLLWGTLACVLVYLLKPLFDKLFLSINTVMSPTTFNIITTILFVAFVIDVIFSFINAISLTKILATITSMKAEIEKLYAQLNQKIEDKIDGSEHAEEIKARIQKLKDDKNAILEKLSFGKTDLIKAHPRAISEKFNSALTEMKERFNNKINRK